MTTPVLSSQNPAPSSTTTTLRPQITFTISNTSNDVDPNSVRVYINSVLAYDPTAGGIQSGFTGSVDFNTGGGFFSFGGSVFNNGLTQIAFFAPASSPTVRVVASDMSSNVMDTTYSFTMPSPPDTISPYLINETNSTYQSNGGIITTFGPISFDIIDDPIDSGSGPNINTLNVNFATFGSQQVILNGIAQSGFTYITSSVSGGFHIDIYPNPPLNLPSFTYTANISVSDFDNNNLNTNFVFSPIQSMNIQFNDFGFGGTTPNFHNRTDSISVQEFTPRFGVPIINNLSVETGYPGGPYIVIYDSGSGGFQAGWTGSLSQSGPQTTTIVYGPIANNMFNVNDSLLLVMTASAGMDSGNQGSNINSSFVSVGPYTNLQYPIYFPLSEFTSNISNDFRFGLLASNTSGTSGQPELQNIQLILNNGPPILAYSASLGGFQAGYTGNVSIPNSGSVLFWVRQLAPFSPSDNVQWNASFLATGSGYNDFETTQNYQYATNGSTDTTFLYSPSTPGFAPVDFTFGLHATLGFGGGGNGLLQIVYIINDGIPEFPWLSGPANSNYVVTDTGFIGGSQDVTVKRNTNFTLGDHVYISVSDQGFYQFTDNAFAFYTIGASVCPDLLTSNSIVLPDGTITQLKSNLTQFTNQKGCTTIAPFILGVKGTLNLRNLNAPYICVNDITRTNVSGTNFPLGRN